MNQYPEILVAGAALAEDRLTGCMVHQRLNGHWVCSFSASRMAGSPPPVEDWLGKSLAVSSQDAEGTSYEHFAGFVVSVDVAYAPSGTYTASVTGYSKTWLMDQSEHKQYYTEKTLADVANLMAARMGGSATVGVAAMRPLHYVQYAETDFSFLDRIVDDYKAWLRPNSTGFEIHDSFQPGANLVWRGDSGGDLMSFSLGATIKPGKFQGAHYDHHVMESKAFPSVTKDPEFYGSVSGLAGAVQQASQASFPPQRTPVRARTKTNDEFGTTLEDESERAVGSSITGTGSSRSMQLVAGNTVTISGNLASAGTFGLVEVVHEWGPGGYGNTFVCTPWKRYRHAVEPPVRTWSGVVPARVTAHNDPKKMGGFRYSFSGRKTAPRSGHVPPVHTPALIGDSCLCRRWGMKWPSLSKTEIRNGRSFWVRCGTACILRRG